MTGLLIWKLSLNGLPLDQRKISCNRFLELDSFLRIIIQCTLLNQNNLRALKWHFFLFLGHFQDLSRQFIFIYVFFCYMYLAVWGHWSSWNKNNYIQLVAKWWRRIWIEFWWWWWGMSHLFSTSVVCEL